MVYISGYEYDFLPSIDEWIVYNGLLPLGLKWRRVWYFG